MVAMEVRLSLLHEGIAAVYQQSSGAVDKVTVVWYVTLTHMVFIEAVVDGQLYFMRGSEFVAPVT